MVQTLSARGTPLVKFGDDKGDKAALVVWDLDRQGKTRPIRPGL
ncbi:MAG: hypothetical protein QF541_20925 [Lentisphaeria bacterium]|jgi:hypothetical protein|nr:hypothetical protein [Lentisphaeria bacterium]